MLSHVARVLKRLHVIFPPHISKEIVFFVFVVYLFWTYTISVHFDAVTHLKLSTAKLKSDKYKRIYKPNVFNLFNYYRPTEAPLFNLLARSR